MLLCVMDVRASYSSLKSRLHSSGEHFNLRKASVLRLDFDISPGLLSNMKRDFSEIVASFPKRLLPVRM
jgi:hypothetical protein